MPPQEFTFSQPNKRINLGHWNLGKIWCLKIQGKKVCSLDLKKWQFYPGLFNGPICNFHTQAYLSSLKKYVFWWSLLRTGHFSWNDQKKLIFDHFFDILPGSGAFDAYNLSLSEGTEYLDHIGCPSTHPEERGGYNSTDLVTFSWNILSCPVRNKNVLFIHKVVKIIMEMFPYITNKWILSIYITLHLYNLS